MGPGGAVRRNVPPAQRPEELPRIDLCLVPHDHWDHMDVSTLRSGFTEIGRRFPGIEVAMHRGTFKQADEPLDEPLEIRRG
jgi:phosphoribosyl 1,2-cyclic phosphodiesterase